MGTIASRLRTRGGGPLVIQALVIGLVLLVGLVFGLSYPAGLPPWRFHGAVAALGLLLGLNVVFLTGSLNAGRKGTASIDGPKEATGTHGSKAGSRYDWPFVIGSAVLVLAAVGMSAQPPFVYLLSVVCGQAIFRRGVWPAGVIFGVACLTAWPGLQIVLGSTFYTILGTEAALAAGIVFVLLLTNLLNRSILQTERAERLLEELRQAGRELEAAHAREKELAVGEERLRLSRDLHDSVTQQLYSVMLYAEAAADVLASGDTATAIRHLRELRDTSQQALREMRILVFDLHRPALEERGLARALQARLDAVEARGGIRARMQVEGTEELDAAIERELYDIAQEALNNVLRHAGARQVQVALRFTGDCVLMEIRDDGAGFAPDPDGPSGGLGIPGMRERARRIGAAFSIESAAGKGTTVAVRIAKADPRQPTLGEGE